MSLPRLNKNSIGKLIPWRLIYRITISFALRLVVLVRGGLVVGRLDLTHGDGLFHLDLTEAATTKTTSTSAFAVAISFPHCAKGSLAIQGGRKGVVVISAMGYDRG